MIPVRDAFEMVTAGLAPVCAETVAVGDALGRVLAEPVVSRVVQPPADVSSMDGYAVRAADTAGAPVFLARVGLAAAGEPADAAVGPGRCVRIFTGAPLPPGADAVVMQENTAVDGDQVRILETVPPGRFVRRRGMDFDQGEALLAAGTVMTARRVGLAAAANVPWLSVRRRPRVAVLATGNELAMPGEPLGPGRIVSSNSLALCAMVRSLGGEPLDLGIARDDEASLRARVDGARLADVLVTIGGASVGERDLVRKVLGDTGLDLGFHKVAMRPGKPLIFGQLGATRVLGLPGNPVSAGVTALLFLRPLVRGLLGLALEDPPFSARLGRALGANDRRQDYLRATLERNPAGDWIATPFERQDSALLKDFAAADALVVRPPLAAPAAAGDRVEVVPLGGTGPAGF